MRVARAELRVEVLAQLPYSAASPAQSCGTTAGWIKYLLTESEKDFFSPRFLNEAVLSHQLCLLGPTKADSCRTGNALFLWERQEPSSSLVPILHGSKEDLKDQSGTQTCTTG